MTVCEEHSIASPQNILHLFKRQIPNLESSKKCVASTGTPRNGFFLHRYFHTSCYHQTNTNDNVLVGTTAIMKFLRSRHIAYEKYYTNIVTACPKHGQVKNLSKCLYINMKSGKLIMPQIVFHFLFLQLGNGQQLLSLLRYQFQLRNFCCLQSNKNVFEQI